MKSMKWMAVVELPATVPQKMSESFVGPSYLPEGRDPDWDTWFSPVQPAGRHKKVTAWELERPMTPKEIAQAILGTAEDDLAVLARKLVKAGHAIVPAQAENLVERANRGENADLWANARHVHLFVKTEKPDNGGIAVMILFKGRDNLWRVPVSTCGLTSNRCREGIFFSHAQSP